MATAALLAALAAASGVAACLGTRALIPVLRRAAVLDRPNERSSHEAPTPRGGGIALVGTIGLAWLGLFAMGAVARVAPAILFAVVLARGGLLARRSARPVAGNAAAGAVGRGAGRDGHC